MAIFSNVKISTKYHKAVKEIEKDDSFKGTVSRNQPKEMQASDLPDFKFFKKNLKQLFKRYSMGLPWWCSG